MDISDIFTHDPLWAVTHTAWNVTTTVELFTFDNIQKYSRNGPLNLF